MAIKLSQTDFVRDWLGQFSGAERAVAEKLADALMLVTGVLPDSWTSS